MSIKIKPGMAPQFGRITMPKGTFLSNPATAHDGGLGAGGGTDLPPVPTLGNLGGTGWGTGVPGLSSPGYVNPGRNVQGGGGLADLILNNLKQVLAFPTPEDQAKVFGQGSVAVNNLIGLPAIEKALSPQSNPTGAFNPPTPASPSNSLVGYNLPTTPLTITPQQLKSMFGDLSPQEIANTMRAKGYTTSYVQGVGQIWVKQGESAPTDQLTNANNYRQGQRVEGNPYEIGATLAPGERVVTAGYLTEAGSIKGRGIGVTGGTPYTDKEGNTVSQYAVTYGGKGDRWKSTVSQDNAGNWVRTYYKTFSKARSRSALKKKQGRKEDAYRARQAQEQASYEASKRQPYNPNETRSEQGSYANSQRQQAMQEAMQNIPTQAGYGQQLVTLRANFG